MKKTISRTYTKEVNICDDCQKEFEYSPTQCDCCGKDVCSDCRQFYSLSDGNDSYFGSVSLCTTCNADYKVRMVAITCQQVFKEAGQKISDLFKQNGWKCRS